MQQGMRGASMYGALLVPLFFSPWTVLYSAEVEERLSLPQLLANPVRVLSSLEPGFEEALLRPLMQTNGRILALQFSLSNKPAIAALIARADAGVPVELVLDPSTLSTARSYIKGSMVVVDGTRGLNPGVRDLIRHEGVRVRVYDGGRGLMHSKAFVMQGVNTGQCKLDVVHSGSANCTGVGMDGTNCEISHLFTDPEIVQRYLGIYAQVREQSRVVVFGEKGAEEELRRGQLPFSTELEPRRRITKKRRIQEEDSEIVDFGEPTSKVAEALLLEHRQERKRRKVTERAQKE